MVINKHIMVSGIELFNSPFVIFENLFLIKNKNMIKIIKNIQNPYAKNSKFKKKLLIHY